MFRLVKCLKPESWFRNSDRNSQTSLSLRFSPLSTQSRCFSFVKGHLGLTTVVSVSSFDSLLPVFLSWALENSYTEINKGSTFTYDLNGLHFFKRINMTLWGPEDVILGKKEFIKSDSKIERWSSKSILLVKSSRFCRANLFPLYGCSVFILFKMYLIFMETGRLCIYTNYKHLST